VSYENLRKSVEARRSATRCVNGHSDGWRRRADGRRFCMKCKLERQRIVRGLRSGRLKLEYDLYHTDIEVLRLSGEGLTAERIGQIMFYTRANIIKIRRRAREKLGARDLHHAIELAYARGVIE
jgi:DNA-binding CsgD family transcriptional regulator